VHSLFKQYHGTAQAADERKCRNTLLKLVQPKLATIEELCQFHTRPYIEFVLNARNFSSPTVYDNNYAQFGIEEVVHTILLESYTTDMDVL
jgi:acetoin utilization deacetylase AcuC-like enzyme